MIGPPASGKTTLAHRLAPLLSGPSGESGLVLSTDVIREELFGDASVQGPWPDIRDRLLQRLHEAVDHDIPVIIDATHAMRPWRLFYTQFLAFSRPVEWIGWWMKTPLPTCLEWSRTRSRPIPEEVIRDYVAAVNNKRFGPDRSEGFAAIVTSNPAKESLGASELEAILKKLDRRITSARNRDSTKLAHLHRYSKLVDLERLLFLIRLLSCFNGLDDRDPATAAGLREILNPPPSGDLAERAAAYLTSWKEVHGGNGECYGDAAAIRSDLAWLEANGFFRLDSSRYEPIDLGTHGPAEGSTVNGGYPALADSRVFRRVFTLLRHVLQEPFDAPEQSDRDAVASGERKGGQPSGFYGYLIDSLADIEGAYEPGQEALLRKDLEGVLTPYGFRPETRGKGRPDNIRHGFFIGSALLSADQLLEVYRALKGAQERLSDQSQQTLLDQLEERLSWAGLLQLERQGQRRSRRAVANRSFTEECPDTLASPTQAQRVERAIRDRRRISLRHLPDPPPSEQERRRGNDGSFVVWPLQLLFHNISWYLAFERYGIGTQEGLIQTLRLDRLVMLGEDGNARRNTEAEHNAALQRLQHLLDLCGGLYFGKSLTGQLAISDQLRDPEIEDASQGIAGIEWFDRLRFSCTPAVFRLIREEPKRFPPAHTRYSRPIADVSEWEQGPQDQLEPNPTSDSHPYPVEILLPRWTVHDDWDLHAWLFRYGDGIRIEQPMQLREKHRGMASDVVAMYGASEYGQ
ncbi:AAA family ATPase [Synechococcus sp. CBW1107]|uniref:AAA family ATPase n=1 Tax=Synechococcus sp. CBW1107 TaxID=2789857 RepID=UPI002AD52A3E|nr:AAA family ATPase [Synechococcus sp. CBW1107]CAK6695402.1 hypothetical protein ICNINCKA_01816 [Synechococcus sp. CBW1107]